MNNWKERDVIWLALSNLMVTENELAYGNNIEALCIVKKTVEFLSEHLGVELER